LRTPFIFWLFLYYPDDQYHALTLRMAGKLKAKFLTTDWILTEVADTLSSGRDHPNVAGFITLLK
jgi:hypothetical protein